MLLWFSFFRFSQRAYGFWLVDIFAFKIDFFSFNMANDYFIATAMVHMKFDVIARKYIKFTLIFCGADS